MNRGLITIALDLDFTSNKEETFVLKLVNIKIFELLPKQAQTISVYFFMIFISKKDPIFFPKPKMSAKTFRLSFLKFENIYPRKSFRTIKFSNEFV